MPTSGHQLHTKKPSPSFDCNATYNEVEKLICASDRLTDADLKLNATYKALLSKSSSATTQKIAEDQTKFKNNLREKCDVAACVNKTIQRKMIQLELMGVGNF